MQRTEAVAAIGVEGALGGVGDAVEGLDETVVLLEVGRVGRDVVCGASQCCAGNCLRE